jgi:hypothetical protein
MTADEQPTAAVPGAPTDGRPPTTRERLLAQSADTLAPHQSLDRIDAAAARVTAGVTLAGSIISGFGLVAATTVANVGIGWALPTVLFAAVSIACAVLATVPAPAKVAPGNLAAVEAFFRDQIRVRGGRLRVSAWTLAAALLLAPLPLVVSALDDPNAAIDLVLTAGGSSRQLTVGVTASGLHDGATITVTVAKAQETVAFARADADEHGRATATLTVRPLPAGTQLRVSADGPGVPARSEQITIPAGRRGDG